MATVRRLRSKWQTQVRRKGIPPRAKGFETKADAEKWARNLEAELDRCGSLQDTRLAERMVKCVWVLGDGVLVRIRIRTAGKIRDTPRNSAANKSPAHLSSESCFTSYMTPRSHGWIPALLCPIWT